MIIYDPFWETLKKKGITTYALRKHYNISSGTIHRLKHNKPMTTAKLNDLCHILRCSIEDIMRYEKD